MRLLIFTGARLNEILTLRCDHVDFEKSVLSLPESKTGPRRSCVGARRTFDCARDYRHELTEGSGSAQSPHWIWDPDLEGSLGYQTGMGQDRTLSRFCLCSAVSHVDRARARYGSYVFVYRGLTLLTNSGSRRQLPCPAQLRTKMPRLSSRASVQMRRNRPLNVNVQAHW